MSQQLPTTHPQLLDAIAAGESFAPEQVARILKAAGKTQEEHAADVATRLKAPPAGVPVPAAKPSPQTPA